MWHPVKKLPPYTVDFAPGGRLATLTTKNFRYKYYTRFTADCVYLNLTCGGWLAKIFYSELNLPKK